MSRVEQTVCDGCGKILYGKDRAAFKSESYIQVQGRISLQCADPEGKHQRADDNWNFTRTPRYYIFITPHKDAETSFCDVKCLQAYIDARKRIWESTRERMLREETDTHPETPLTTSPFKRKKERNYVEDNL